MNLFKTLLIASIFTSLSASAATGVTLHIPGSGQSVRISVLGDKIIRVSAVPGDTIPATQSLIVVAQKPFDDFTVDTIGAHCTVATKYVKVKVDKADGTVSFHDSRDSLLLAENPGGRSFTPITVEGETAYTVSQTFASPDDNEGLYGLGQHQAEEFNYKGKNEELFQYNTKVSVPFVVSTGNYGILWDSYSFCRWGNQADYLQLGEAFNLYDRDGKPGALTGTYTPKDGLPLTRREEKIYFEHLKTHDLAHVVNLPEDFKYSGSNIVYEGYIEPQMSGRHDFIMYYSGYQKIYMDSTLVVPERWRTAWNPNSYKFSVELEKGKRVPLRIEWQPNGGVAYCGLRAYKPRSVAERNQMAWWGEMQDMIDYYFVYGRDMDDVISGYRTLTGKAPVMPKWAMGYWQSREKYNTDDEVLGTLAEYRRRNIPIDNIVIDWLHWPQDSWGSHEFDPKRFPNPKGMADSIHALNGRLMVSVWPKFYVTTDHYKEFDRNGWMYRQAVTDSIRDWVGPGYLGSFYDAYNPEARQLFWGQMKDHYYPLGVDAWWMDASEPNVRDCVNMDYRKALCGPTYLGPSTKYFNAYALMNAEAIYDGQRSTDPNRRVFLLTRSGFPGQQRYSTATWSGDIATRWEDMRAQLTAGLNFSVSGIPWWSMDIGGFCVEDRYVKAQKEFNKTGVENDDLREWRELNTRWFQFGAFAPLYRAHGQWPFREIFNIAPEDHPAYESMLYYTRLRYSLMPYIYSMAGMTHFDDYTVMRPLVMDFTADIATRNIGNQYMFGPAVMVSPVTEYGARSREVYLPSETMWYDFYNGTPLQGGTTIEAEAPYGRVPLHVRAGSIIPVGPNIQWTDQHPADVIDLYVYAGANGSFSLYEDEGTNYDYEKGLYARIPISWDDDAKTITIGKREGSFEGMLENRTFRVICITPDSPKGFAANAHAISLEYSGEEVIRELRMEN
ncbi:MAG: DUF5110 domain-containing protein [Muribaculaceae bacterium]|nr:DUF5110 domain-containing protein [Muribaculaceae bacterium]